MKLIALLVGLLIERLATRQFHLRQLHWLDSVIDAGLGRAAAIPALPPIVVVGGLAFLMVLPLLILLYLLGDFAYGLAYLLIAVAVLFFSFGPWDLSGQIDAYCAAIEQGDDAAVRQAATALIERPVPDDVADRTRNVEEAVFVQANNRLFAVIFWFMVLGPPGALGHRVVDRIRRRARSIVPPANNEAEPDIDEPDSDEPAARAYADAASTLHGWVAWVPARLTLLGYALAGSFDAATAAWRRDDAPDAGEPHEHSERLLARVGSAALALEPMDGEAPADRAVRGAIAANGLVFRLLGIWAVVIAAMTLYGWSV